jgi:hypothetical protein
MAFQLLMMEAVMAFPESLFPCSLCNDPVDLRTAKTDEYGKAIHEDCYVLRMRMKRGMLRSSQDPSSEATRLLQQVNIPVI